MRASTGEAFGRIEAEIAGEKVAALRRIAETLERLLEQLRGIERRIGEEAEPQAAYAHHETLRQQARRYRWYLEVQREALGMFRHDDLGSRWRVPKPLRPLPSGPGGE